MRKILFMATLAISAFACPLCQAEWGGPDVYYHPETGAYRTNEGERVHVRDPGAKQRRVEWKYGRYSIYAMRRRFDLVERYREERRERESRMEDRHDDDWRSERDRDDRRLECKPRLNTVGQQALSKDNAEKASVTAWMDMARYRWGEMYADFSFSRRRDIRCVLSSPGAGLRGLVNHDETMTDHYRCEIAAEPCTPSRKPMERD